MSEWKLNTGRNVHEEITVWTAEYWINLKAVQFDGSLGSIIQVGLKPNQVRELAAALISAADAVDASATLKGK